MVRQFGPNSALANSSNCASVGFNFVLCYPCGTHALEWEKLCSTGGVPFPCTAFIVPVCRNTLKIIL